MPIWLQILVSASTLLYPLVAAYLSLRFANVMQSIQLATTVTAAAFQKELVELKESLRTEMQAGFVSVKVNVVEQERIREELNYVKQELVNMRGFCLICQKVLQDKTNPDLLIVKPSKLG